ncbi:hypothetical protein SRB5_04990 [Streptomyces sp. RB5]|uniref:TM helix repeat-containing protein n=1 Tax=Streptomyces smaragdinus TaxID=2585196 RepID=A0A7K0CAA0_9ACTN|nr:hypothetical protein [Streptomyces smaragdinus]MQY10391.1 hypothetical protein [Streptomyces smaragdinus]
MFVELALSVDFGQGFTDAISAVISFIPKLLGFLAVLVIGWFVVKIVVKAVDKLLRKMGLERLTERAGINRWLSGSKYDGTGILMKVVYYALMLVVLQLALGVFGPNPVSDMISAVVAWIPRALVACVILVVAFAIAKAVRDIIGSALNQMSYGKTVATVVWAFIAMLGVIAALGQAGIATAITGPLLIAVLATVAGVLIVGVGGGMVTPMRSRWERWLNTAERETTNARSSVSAYQAGRADAAAGQPAPGTYAGPMDDEGSTGMR